MQVIAIKTDKVLPGATSVCEFVAKALPSIGEDTIVVVTSKIVSLCEGRVVAVDSVDEQELVIRESEQYLLPSSSKYNYSLTITNNVLIPMAGIDSSNADENYVLWPANPQATANQVRAYLGKQYGLKRIGVVIADSTSHPLRGGTTGIALAHSGFLGLKSYVGRPDIFGRRFSFSHANIADGLAATAVLVMGEGAEQTPICVVSDFGSVQFQQRDPNSTELEELYVSPDEDLFGPLINGLDWQSGGRDVSNHSE